MLFSLRPAFQVGTYLYFQANIDAIVAQFCINKERPKLKCNGKCYLADQLTLSNKTNNGDDINSTALLVDAFFPLFFEAVHETVLESFNIQEQRVFFEYSSMFTSTNLEAVTPPPKVAA